MVGKRLRLIRDEAGVSQLRLAELVGLSRETIIRIELGKSSPQVKTLEKFADALGVEVIDFFREESGGTA